MLEKTLEEILMIVDYYSLKFTKDGKISIGEVRKLSAKEDLNRLKIQLDNINPNEYLFKNEKEEIETSKKSTNIDVILQLISLKLLEFGDDFNSILHEKLDLDIKNEIDDLRTHPDINEFNDEEIINNANGIPNYGATYTDRIWREYRKTSRDFANIVESSLFNEKPTKDWAKKVKDDIKVKTRKLLRSLEQIVVSEVGTSLVVAILDMVKHSNMKRVQVVCEPTACDKCSPFDGDILYVDDVVFGGNAPKWHPNCRCILIPYV